MLIAITGATGLIGRAVAPILKGAGHSILSVVRRPPGPGEVGWDPISGSIDATGLEGVDAVIHFAAENVASGRWTAVRKDRIRMSRIRGTDLLCRGLARLAKPPRVLICASAIGYYGDCGARMLDESQPPGNDFLANVVRDWENAAQPALDAGIRVVQLRFGIVLAGNGGALPKMILPFQLGLGGRLGRGRQYWSWIAIGDVVGIVSHALATETLSGPVNATAPKPVTNLQFTKTLGRVMSRPTLFPVPACILKIVLGEMAESLLLASIRARPERLLAAGYIFQHSELEPALREILFPRAD
ncbi:MAG: TIGR01777 family oxidoreductase [Pirellulales bacterium]|nr:TIGR01777 family oxidoreductase [Pirellulales bacterium]